jgi:phosphoglycolate phosphatase
MSSMCVEPTLEHSSSRSILHRSSCTNQHIKVFCDLDGPLIDVSERYYKTYQLALAETQANAQSQGHELHLTPLSASQFWRMKQARMPDTEIAHGSGLRHGEVEQFLATVQKMVNQPLLLHADRLQSGVARSLQVLQQQGIEVSVVTLRCQGQAFQLLRHYQIDHFFAQIRGTNDPLAVYQNYAVCKQQLLSDVMTQSGIDPSHTDCWMIGDTEADVIAGQMLGLSTIAVTCGMRNYRYLEKLHPTSIQPNLSLAIHYLLNKVLLH